MTVMMKKTFVAKTGEHQGPVVGGGCDRQSRRPFGERYRHDFDGQASPHLHAARRYRRFRDRHQRRQGDFHRQEWDQKQYAWVTGYPGQKIEKAGNRLQRRPELILREAVRRMLPKNKLAFKMLDKLKLYPGTEHPHQAQLPEKIELGKK